MAVFVAVAEELSFSAAARRLRMSRPAVTRAVGALEDAVGVQLLVRTTRKVMLSQVGERYLEDCRRILEAVTEAGDAARGSHSEPVGLLTITAPLVFGRLHVAPVMGSFLEAWPALSARLLLLDRVVNLVEEGIDVAIRIGDMPDSAQQAVRVGEVRHTLVGSPDYLARHGPPPDPGALRDHVLVSHSARRQWRFVGGAASLAPRATVNDAQTAVDMATAGFGLTQVLSYQCASAVSAGALVRLLPEHELPPIPVRIVWSAGRRVPARTRAFIDHAAEALRERLAG